MKEKTIKWEQDRGSFLGRNGLFKLRGVRVTVNQNDLYLEAVNSKGKVARCLLCLPISESKNLIRAIKEVSK
jgi:hypothetical protein